MDLGEFTLCLNMADLRGLLELCQRLEFELIDDRQQDQWAVLRHGDLALSLYQGHIDRNLMNFRGGDIQDVARQAEIKGVKFSRPAAVESDGCWSAEAVDPDGNVLYFNTFPEEREECLRRGQLSAR